MLTVNVYVIYDVITVDYCKCILLYSPLNLYLYVHWILYFKLLLLLYGFYLFSSHYKQQHVSINTSRSIVFCNCASIIIILKRSFHIIYSLHVGLPNIRIFRSLMCALLIMWKCYI